TSSRERGSMTATRSSGPTPWPMKLVFGAGTHACPGARLARAQLDDTLAALAPHRPTVRRARVDRGAALPGWRSLTVRASGALGSLENR
ncbi:hypothetical protein ACWCQV_28120, partial [Streptomyces eurythermus]